jgi:hypothetical protein
VPSYTVGYIDVYRNGVRLVSTDFTATTGTTVVLANACTVGDAVVTESFYVSSVLNAIPATAGSVSDSYIVDVSASKLTGSRTIPKATMPTGSVLQVVSATFNTNFSTNSASFVSTSITLNITPSSSSSKVLLSFSGGQIDVGNGRGQASLTFYRGGTNLSSGNYGFACIFLTGPASFEMQVPAAMQYLDSPATTSSTAYTVYLISNSGGTVYMSTNSNAMTITAMEIAA